MNNKLVPELYVTDIEKSVAFYTNILGFHIKHERPENRFAYMEREGAELMLDEIDNSPRTWIIAPLEYPYGRGINLQIEVSNVDALYQSVRKANQPIFLEVEERWYRCNDVLAGNRQFLVQDPDGYLLRFFQDLGEKPAP